MCLKSRKDTQVRIELEEIEDHLGRLADSGYVDEKMTSDESLC